MIEKFTDEEIKQILKELGIKEKKSSKNSVCGQHEEELKLLWCDKRNYLINSSVNVMESVFKVCDITLCNFTKDKRTGRVRFKGEIDSEIEEEYSEMYAEIVEIIKKHNKKFKGWDVDDKRGNSKDYSYYG